MRSAFMSFRRDKACAPLFAIAVSLLAAPAFAEDGESRALEFTLITGDTARAQVLEDGGIGAARLLAADGSELVTSLFQSGDNVYVIPEGIQPLVDAGRIDMELFNLANLRDAGYDNASRDTFSILVEFEDGVALQALPGTQLTTSFDAIDMAALEVDKAEVANLWADIIVNADIEKVWLDGAVKAHKASEVLTPTVPLTGALGEYAKYYDGTGVTVAVLDSGYDLEHADLAGQVDMVETWVWNSNGDDTYGHGTHVASTIAGTGAESGGLWAGVAPGARLLVGQVLGNTGSGSQSGIMQGMQWAVDNGADIVNMSLGSAASSCGGGIVSLLEALSEQALFVVSAGNSSLRESIGSPGCAPSALTVGAIDRDNETAVFSSRGPGPDGLSAKPDIASQGVAVVAAASGGFGDTAYRVYSGTSMAAPHVAGGAAIVLQARPELTPVELKNVLTSSVLATDAHVLDQGAGPMDIDRAIRQVVTAPANISLGQFLQAGAGLEATGVIPLHNLGGEAIELKVRMDLIGDDGDTQLPATLARLGVKRVTVPAYGSVDIPVTIDTGVALRNGAYGTITGRITATTTGNADVRVIAPFSFWIEPPMIDLTVKAFDRFDNPVQSPSSFSLLNAEDERGTRWSLYSGEYTVRVPAGRYSVVAHIMTRDDETNQGLVASAALMAELGVKLDKDTTLEFHAQEAQRVDFRADRPIDTQGFSFGFSYDLDENGNVKAGSYELAPQYVDELYGWSRGRDDRFRYFATTRAFAPETLLTTGGGAEIGYTNVSQAPMFHGEGSAEVVLVDPATPAGFEAVDLAGKIAMVNLTQYQYPSSYAHLRPALEAGAIGLVINYPDTVGRYNRSLASTIPVVTLAAVEGDKLLAELSNGPVTLNWSGSAPERTPYAYTLAHVVDGKVQAGQVRVHDHELARIDATYHSQGDERFVFTDMYIGVPGLNAFYATGSTQMVAAPVQRTEFYTADERVAWTNIVMPNFYIHNGAYYDGARRMVAGSQETTSWMKSPTGASLWATAIPVMWRDTNQMQVSIPDYGDAAGHDGSPGRYIDSGFTYYYVDGVRTSPSGGLLPLPDEEALVRVERSFYRRADVSPVYHFTGVAYDTNWEFLTSSEQQGPQPMLMPSIDVPSSMYNTVAAGTPTVIGVGAKTDIDPDVELADVQVQYAYGTDSRTYQVAADAWQDAQVEFVDGQWFATVPNTAASGQYVHLRVTLADTGSSTVEQTMLRSYLLD